MGRRLAFAIPVILLLLLAACSSGNDGGGGLAGDDDGVAAMLASLPLPPMVDEVDEDVPLVVAYGDLARAARLAGVELPESPDAELEDQIAVLNAISGQPVTDDGEGTPVAVMLPEAAHVERLRDVEAFVDDVGWSVFDVRRYVEMQVPLSNVTVMEGGFDEDRIAEALGEPDDGVWTAGDPEGRTDTTPARPLGESLRLALDDDRLVITRWDSQMEEVRGGGSGTPMVADDDVMVALAEAVDDADAYSALLYRGILSFGPSLETPEQAEERCGEVLQEPFTGIATAIADDDGPVFVLAYVHADDAAAEANAGSLQRLLDDGTSGLTKEPWSEQLEVDEITTDGPVLVARLRPVDPGGAVLWQQPVFRGDNLATYC